MFGMTNARPGMGLTGNRGLTETGVTFARKKVVSADDTLTVGWR